LNTGSLAKNKKLLIVDDDRLILVTLAQGLTSCGYSVQTAESVDDAELILAGGEHFDLVIIDYSMPKRNGLELAERLRTLDQIPFIFLTAYSDDKFVNQASVYGALSYLVKPIDPIQIGPVIKSAIDRSVDMNKLNESKIELQTALDKDRDINVAIGITMMQHQLSRKAAYELLRNTSRNQRCKLDVIAKDIVSSVEDSNAHTSNKT